MTETKALALIERAISEHRECHPSSRRFVSVGALLASPPPEPSIEDVFVRAVNDWLCSAKNLKQRGLTYDGAYVFVAKPWLRGLVGWYALSDLGRLAGPSGYAALVDAWNAQWSGLVPEGSP